MARQGRLHVPNATYFVANRFRPGLEVLVATPHRSHTNEDLRRIDANRKCFEALLAYVCTRWCARVHAYCWLPDAALLLIEISHVPLETILRGLRGPFSHALRARTDIELPLYAGRYHTLLVDTEEFFLDFMRHIFWTPVNARLCQHPLAYEHSSARVCIGEPAPAFLDPTAAVAEMAARGIGSRPSFLRFLNSAPSPSFASLLAHGSRSDQRVAGGVMFVREARQRAHRAGHPIDLDAIIGWVSRRLGIAAGEIVERPRNRRAVEARAFAAWLSTCTGAATLSEVADRFSCSPSSLHRAIRHYARLRPRLFNPGVLAEVHEALAAEGVRTGGASEPDDGATRGED
jgi:putative transposase